MFHFTETLRFIKVALGFEPLKAIGDAVAKYEKKNELLKQSQIKNKSFDWIKNIIEDVTIYQAGKLIKH